jgi:SAM-dependent methyltransferase
MRRSLTSLLLCAACSAPTPAPHTAAAPPSEGPPEAPAESAPPPSGHHHGAGYHKDFSDAEAFSGSFDDPARDGWQHPREVVALLQIPKGSVVADLGAGTGYFAAHLSEGVGPSGKVLALDVEPKMIDFLKRRVHEQKLPNVEPRLVQADDPGLAPGSVARVLVVNTWHHIDDRANYARKLAQGLAPGGEIWIVDFTLESEHGPPPQYRLEAKQVIMELEQGGLHAQLIEPEPLPRQYIVRARR